ncbi:MAG TPA: hypothetical protein VLK25_04485 [Allosphingosinicella sp.]|nr:hypothetical protein [Allosphingosinicella sp.]
MRSFAAAVLLLGLASCSFDYHLWGGFVDGRLALMPEKRAPPGACPDIAISDAAGRAVWSFRPSAAMLARPNGCRNWLPLRYGRAPAGSETIVRARTLRTGTVYVLEGYAGDLMQAAFRFHRRGNRIAVENLDLGSDEVIAARTAARQRRDREDRRDFEAKMRPRNEAVEGPHGDRPLPAERD